MMYTAKDNKEPAKPTRTKKYLTSVRTLQPGNFSSFSKPSAQLLFVATSTEKYSSTVAQPASADLSGILMSLFRRLMALEAALTSLRITAVRLLGYPSPQDQREVFRDLRRLQQDSEKRI